MKDTEENLIMSEAEEIAENTHSEDAQIMGEVREIGESGDAGEVLEIEEAGEAGGFGDDIGDSGDDRDVGDSGDTGADEGLSMAGEELAVANEETSVADDVPDEEASIADEEPSMLEEELAVADEETSVAEDVLDNETSIADEEPSMLEEETSVPDEETSVAEDAPDEEASIADEEPSMLEEETSVPDEEPSYNETTTSVADEEEFFAEEMMPMQLEPVFKEIPTTPDNYCGDLQEAIEVGAISLINRQNILEELRQLVDNIEHTTREQVDKLKQSYNRMAKAEIEELRKVFIENGGDEADFHIPKDEFEAELKDLLAQYKQKKALSLEREEAKKEENYIKKLRLIDRIQALVESQDDFNKRYNEFKEIQQRWKEYNPVPHGHTKELWRNYQIQTEKFFDLVKINNQFRDYDFKKNLELKTILCEAVERLADEPDAISAYYQSQKLFMQWREIGPVARNVRESLWARFKAASAVVNKNQQAHFDSLKEKEEENLKEKQTFCQIAESIDYESLKTYNDWEKKTQQVIEMQKKWHATGFPAKRHSNKLFDRFRKACDHFFNQKSAFYKSLKKEMEKNLQQRKQLIEKAEALKERTDWKQATKEIVELQNEWKKIGPIPRKHSDLLWKQFTSTCDYFFEQKNQTSNSQKSSESSNLATKKLLIQKIKTLDSKMSNSEALTNLKLLIAEWNAVGHVPFKDKDKIYKAFREAVDKQYDRLNVAQSDRKIQQYRSILTEISDGGQNKGKLHNEREKLMRMYERMKGELQTFENNVGFFNVSSKGGGAMLKEMENRIERLRNEMELIVKKIDAIDENLE